jgi:hypothetical protein
MKRKKKRLTAMRFRKGDPAHNLLAATQHWVHANGGKLLVVGGIGLMSNNLDRYKFSVVVGCMGRKPEIKKPQ